MQNHIIEKFVPPIFYPGNLDLPALEKLTGKKWSLSSSGTASLIKILKAFPADTEILVPSFICDSVLRAIKESNCRPLFYDVDPLDLNGDIESVKRICETQSPKVLLVASLFGNPANLVEFEKLAREKNIFMIDDSAQSFGAKLENRWCGTFGDAGLYSFSPGKSTAGHLGSLLWSSKSFESSRKRIMNKLMSAIKYWDFTLNRQNIYRLGHFRFVTKILTYLNVFVSRSPWFYEMIPGKKDQEIMGGILGMVQGGALAWQNKIIRKFDKALAEKKIFKPLIGQRGVSQNFKMVLVCSDAEARKRVTKKLSEYRIYNSSSYTFNVNEWTPNAKTLIDRIIELPIENDEKKMAYLMTALNDFE